MVIKILSSTKYPGVQLQAGKTEEVPDAHARQLIRMGKAVQAEKEIDVEINPVDLEKMKKNELVSYAEEHEVDLTQGMTKAEIIAAIEAGE